MMQLMAELSAVLGDNAVRSGADIEPRHLRDWAVPSGADEAPLAVAYPRDTAEVAAVLKLCNARRVPVVAQGGLTGLTGGATPVKGCIVLSLERMRHIEEVDGDAATMTVQSGVTLQAIQEAAEAAGLFFPLDLGARGSCQIGGNLSTNAGGNRVVRFGMCRDLVLGLEVVLADGTIVSELNKMLKNNAGYDVKQLFVGSEGTLGVITRAVLRLHPKPVAVCTALCGLDDYDRVRGLLRLARRRLGGSMSAFELMSPLFYRLGCGVAGRPAPLAGAHGSYVLLETMGPDAEAEQSRCEQAIAAAIDEGLVNDAVVAQSSDQAAGLWAIRDSSGSFNQTFSPHINFDVSIPVGRIGAFMEECAKRLTQAWPAMDIVFFGHVADANLHVTVHLDADPMPVDAIDRTLYGVVRDWQGSVSAEHGIGLLKRDFLSYSRSPATIDLMRRLKGALDPNHILNPGKVFR